MKDRIKISDLQDNTEHQVLVPTRLNGHFWRDEIDNEGIFHFISASVVDCSSVFDEAYWDDQFLDFESLHEALSFDEYHSTTKVLKDNFSVFSHKSIHVLQKAWEFFSSGGDSYSQAEITCNGRVYKKARIFVCKNYYIGTGIFILQGEQWSNHESIFMNETFDLKVSEIEFSNLIDIVNLTIDAGRLSSNRTLVGYIEKNFNDRIPNKISDVHLVNDIETLRQQNLDDVFGERDS